MMMMMMMAAAANDFGTRASPSTTDVSEDSVDVKVKPVTLSGSVSMSAVAATTPSRTRNKRKSAEPRKLKEIIPGIKRHCWTSDSIGQVEPDDSSNGLVDAEKALLKVKSATSKVQQRDNKQRTRISAVTPSTSTSGFETWSQKKQRKLMSSTGVKRSSSKSKRCAMADDQIRDVASKKSSNGPLPRSLSSSAAAASTDDADADDEKSSLACLGLPFDVRNILGPSATALLSSSPSAFERLKRAGAKMADRRPSSPPVYDNDDDEEEEEEEEDDDEDADRDVDDGASPSGTSYLHGDVESESTSGGNSSRHKQTNYKNMTRERRIEANARERTRVHTISAAFDNLRRAVPSYSCHQKLSKLAILRIACSYILALASLNDQDYSSQQNCPMFSECVDLCTRTIQAEGKARKRKD